MDGKRKCSGLAEFGTNIRFYIEPYFNSFKSTKLIPEDYTMLSQDALQASLGWNMEDSSPVKMMSGQLHLQQPKGGADPPDHCAQLRLLQLLTLTLLHQYKYEVVPPRVSIEVRHSCPRVSGKLLH